MSDRPPLGPRLARTAALALSLGLASFVIVHAQFGCDSPASNAPPAKEPAKTDAPAAKPAAEPNSELEAQPTEAQPTDAQPATPSDDAPAPNPVFMPASKSGGDFGAMPFPGEPPPSQQHPQAPPK
jgi:hypothetical protein